MKNLKRILAVSLILVIALSLSACMHPKDEIAVTIGDVEFTSAYYMCALITADSDAKNQLDEEKENSTDKIDYYSKKIDGVKFVKWVEEAAMNSLKEIAAYKILCKENKVEIPEEDLTEAKAYANAYWTSYGYSAYFEPNGVSLSTYTDYFVDSYYAEVYFEHLYGEGGKKEISEDTVKTKMYGNFLIANILQANYTTGTDADKTNAETKKKFEGYLEDLKNGKKTFEEVYKEYNNIKDEDTKEETTDDAKDEDSKELEPKDKYATILGAAETVYESDNYDAVKAMKVGEMKLIELEDKAGIVLAIKQDITADPYYFENLDMITRHLIKDDEYEEEIKEYAIELEADINDYAVKRFKVKNIKEPTA